jgi:hypothetical protein
MLKLHVTVSLLHKQCDALFGFAALIMIDKPLGQKDGNMFCCNIQLLQAVSAIDWNYV